MVNKNNEIDTTPASNDYSKEEIYYLRAFEKLEKEGKHTWNWAAFFFQDTWILYRKMYLCSIALLLPSITLSFFDTFMGVMIKQSRNLTLLAVFALLHITIMCLFGYYGNYLYYRTVKAKIAKGYHLIDKYRPTSIFAIFDFAMPIVALGDFLLKRYFEKHSKSCEDQDSTVSTENIRDYLSIPQSSHWITIVTNFCAFLVPICILILSIYQSNCCNFFACDDF